MIRRTAYPLALTALAMLAGMFVYEWLKELFLPELTKWESHFVTILFSTLLAMVAGFFVLRRLRTGAESARQSQSTFRALTDNSLDVVTILGADGTILYESPSLQRVLGWPPDEIIGRSAFEFVHPEDLPGIGASFQEVAAEAGGLREVRFRFRHLDGSWRTLESLCKNLLSDPAIGGIVVNSRDITARVAADRALRESEAFKSAILDSALDGIITIDHLGIVQEFNPAAQAIFGYTRAEAVGQEMAALIVPPDLREAHRAGMARFLQTGIGPLLGRRVEIKGQHAHGELLPLELAINRVALEGPPVFTGYVRDITERVVAEAALRAAKEEADRASQAKTDFLARTSHELRTPLNAILGFGQLLEMGDLPPREGESVEQILLAGRHLLKIVDEVLDIAAVESGRIVFLLESVSIAGIVRETLDLTQPLAAARHITFALENEEAWKKSYVYADAQRLKQVLLNLFANAVKYNRPGGSVTFSCEDDFSGRRRMIVRDTGLGLSPDQLERIFTPFERAGAERTEVEGSGLGLSLCKSLLFSMGGSIGVESVEGEGSTFWLKLPGSPAPLPAPASPDDERENHPSAAPSTVLYIEDNLSNLKLIESIFARRARTNLLVAMQGRTGIDLAHARRPDLILLDLHLPDIMGDRVLAALRASPETRDIPVVILSADATGGQAERLREAGASEYLTKPLDLAAFLRVVETLLPPAL